MRRFLITLLLLPLFLLPALLLISHRINAIAEKSALHSLFLATQQLKYDIQSQIEWFGERLHVISSLLIERSEPLDAPPIQHMLDRLSQQRIPPVGRLRILLPDGRTVHPDGITAASPETRAAFEEDLRRAPFLSPLEDDPDGGGAKVVRHCVPIVNGKETLGLLVAVIDVEKIPRFLQFQNMNRNYQIYLVEGKSGNFLVDTWHGTPGTLREFGMGKTKTGYDWKKMGEDIAQEKGGNLIFLSRGAGEYFYLHYEPLHINAWSVMLSLPERVVLHDANDIKSHLFRLQIFTVAVFALFLFWALYAAIRENRRKSEQLNLARQALGLEKQLAVAHRDAGVMHDALRTVARILTAEHCSFLLFREGKPWKLYSSDPSHDFASIPELPSLQRMLLEKRKMLLDAVTIRDLLPAEEQRLLWGMGISNMLLCLVGESRNSLIHGILYAANTKQRWSDADVGTLDLVVPSFASLLANIATRMRLEEKSELDALTGLRNRNRFEADLAALPAQPLRTLTCVYADANGLRELNNGQGHEAGDRLLRYVARALAEVFGTETTYRIGGDEFAAVVPDLEEGVAQRKLDAFQRAVAEQGYSCAAGLATSPWPADIPALLKIAEKRMYADKRRFYQEPGNDRRKKRYDFSGQ